MYQKEEMFGGDGVKELGVLLRDTSKQLSVADLFVGT